LRCRVNKTAVLLAVTFTLLLSRNYGVRINPFTIVHGHSMEPSISDWAVLKVDHNIPGVITRGTVVLVSMPGESVIVKRVVGLPHERVSFVLGEVFVNGHMLREPYLRSETTTFCWDKQSIVAGADDYVVLGDNRLTSQDSRSFGPISRDRIVGILEVHSPRARLQARPEFRLIPKCRWEQQMRTLTQL